MVGYIWTKQNINPPSTPQHPPCPRGDLCFLISTSDQSSLVAAPIMFSHVPWLLNLSFWTSLFTNRLITSPSSLQTLAFKTCFNQIIDHLPSSLTRTHFWGHFSINLLTTSLPPSPLLFAWRPHQSIICPLSSLTWVHLTCSNNLSTSCLPSLPHSSNPQTSDIPWTISLSLLFNSATTQHSSLFRRAHSVLPSSFPLFPLPLSRVHLPNGLDGLPVSTKSKASQRWSTTVNDG